MYRSIVIISDAKKLKVRWPEDKFAELCVRLARETSATVYVLAGPADQALLGAFAGLWSERLRLFEGRSLEEDAAFMEVCSLVVTSSSGPMHLAAAVGAPTVSILGDYTYDCWRPLGEDHRTIHSGLPHGEVRPVPVEDVFRVVQARYQELCGEGQGGSPG